MEVLTTSDCSITTFQVILSKAEIKQTEGITVFSCEAVNILVSSSSVFSLCHCFPDMFLLVL